MRCHDEEGSMFDLILKGGRVLDGAGNSDVPADVAVEGGRIAAVGQLGAAEAREIVDVTGLTVCPGFIDAHCHSDALPFASDPLPAKILQGVTTEVNGNCGSTAYPMVSDRADLLKEHQAGLFADMPWDWQRAGVPVELSHLKAAGRSNHGRAGELLALLEQGRARGVEVTGDAYPYDAGSTRMAALLPPWSQEGGRELLLERLTIPSEREHIKRDFRDGIPG